MNTDPDPLTDRSVHLAPADHLLLMLGVVALWTVSHRYLSLTLDGELYGIQALARLHPALAQDLYLANTSQDQFTLFSPLYAAAIRQFGLQPAGYLLFGACRAIYLAAAWYLMSRLTSRPTAWVAVAALICTVSPYGAFGIFESASDYLTARTVAEALVVAAIATFYRSRLLAAALVAAALLMHPLMALPGLLLLVFLALPTRIALGLFAAGLAGTALLALAVGRGWVAVGPLVVMSPAWVEVVRERSQFLFLDLWNFNDWKIQARPFLSLALAYGCLDSPAIRRLCLAAAVVGTAGLGVAAIGSAFGPVAILVQGQAWRWMWITGFVAIAVAVPAAGALWRSHRCGYLCAVLLAAGWVFPPVDSDLCLAAAGLLWLLSAHVGLERDWLLRYAAYALIAMVLGWTLISLVHPALAQVRPASASARAAEWLRATFSLQGFSLTLFAGLLWLVVAGHRARWSAVAICAVLIVLALPTLVGGTGAQAIAERDLVSDWREAIPEGSNVLLLPLRKTAAFPWFGLERPSYLTLTQSAGVVFSAATAAEVRRRSEVLQPVAEADWRITSRILALQRHQALPEPNRPLTADALRRICVDAALGFVVAREAVGFDPITNVKPGPWKDWNLYDCRRVRGADPRS